MLKDPDKNEVTVSAVSEIKTKTDCDEGKSSTKQRTAMAISLDTIYNEYGDMIYTYLLHQVTDRETTNDLFQDVMLKISKNIKNYQSTGSFKSWLIVITRNHLLDHRRKKARWGRILSSRIHKDNPEKKKRIAEIIPFENPARFMEDEEIRLQLSAALLQLPEDQREVIDLHYNCDFSLRQISEMLDCSINTVASRVRYGLKKLKKILEV